MRVTGRLLPLVLAALLAACHDVTGPTDPLARPGTVLREESTCNPTTAIIPCPEEPVAGTSWNFFAPPNDILYQAPYDPSPGAAGIWLGANVTPATCFNDRTPNIVDADHDWLDDRCELELARGFAPRWGMGIQDNCPGGEPAWAAKYFPSAGVVRLAFMPAYYVDCGEGDTWFNIGAGHPGDSEFTMVEVGFNAATQHWEFRVMWLSAHFGTDGNRSQWVPASETQFTQRYLAHPYIAVSAHKHANYKSESKCNNTLAAAAGYGEYCYGSTTNPFRFPINPARNAGSRHRDLMGCVGSTGSFAGNGRTECFYTRKHFLGWQQVDPAIWDRSPGTTPYHDFLMSDKFESRNGSWGPGPTAYTPPLPGDDPTQPPTEGCPDSTQIICT